MAVEGGEVVLFVVRFLIVPAPPENADPFEGEGAQDGVVRFAGLFLLMIVGLSPSAARDRLAGPAPGSVAKSSARGCAAKTSAMRASSKTIWPA